MKKFIFASLVVAVVALAGCKKDEVDNFSAQPGDAIAFGVRAEGTRTVYGDQNSDNSWPIYWQANDQIRIFSNQAQGTKDTSGNTYADYIVNGDGTASKATIKAANENYLKWNAEYGVDHTFYAVYPGNNKNITVNENGIATFPINRNQVCDLESNTDGNYVFKPRMTNQYMVATSSENPKDLADDAVWLDFKPVMTTLDIIVNGQSVSNYSGNITITGVSIIMEYKTSQANASTFAYDINNNTITASGSSDATTGEYSNTIFIGLENGDVDAIELAPGKTLKLTAFIPPVKGIDYTMKLRVHAAGTTELIATLANATAAGGAVINNGSNTVLTPSSKAQFTLPNISNPLPEGNNWITPLSGDILLTQLSIPGTHDAGAGEDVDVELFSLFGWTPSISIGSTQVRSIEEQWDMGIRAFDFRPAVYEDDGEVYIYHGVAKSSNKMDDVFGMLCKKLESNKKELAIVVIRHENDVINFIEGIGLGISGGKSTDESVWKEKMNSIIAKYSNYIATYKVDMTIDDCRGKILIIDREGKLDNCVYLSDWYDRALGYPNTNSKHTIGGSEPLWLQDFYNPMEDSEMVSKINAIITNMNYSSTFDNDTFTENTWMINHCSGYNSGYDSGIMKYIVSAIKFSTSNGYRGNAQNNHPIVYNYLMSDIGQSITGTVGGQTITATRTEYGPTGIVLMDFVGDRTSNGYSVYGDILPQAIIDNNYRYHMKRKGE